MATPTLTSHLYSLSTAKPYSAATEHPFLTAAGDGTLPHDQLSLYLSQDRIYAAHGYPRFIGHLLAAIPYSSLHKLDSPEERFNKRILGMLHYALTNVIRETNFFVDTAATFGLDLEGWSERKGTRDYLAEMTRVGASGRIEDGLVFLWAMERVYLDAWKYVGSTASAAGNLPSTPTTEAVRLFIDNWTNVEFEKFVDDLASLVDDLNIKPGSEAWLRAEQIWSRVVELEETFWPVDGEERSLRK